jgi:hypothetical protein
MVDFKLQESKVFSNGDDAMCEARTLSSSEVHIKNLVDITISNYFYFYC